MKYLQTKIRKCASVITLIDCFIFIVILWLISMSASSTLWVFCIGVVFNALITLLCACAMISKKDFFHKNWPDLLPTWLFLFSKLAITNLLWLIPIAVFSLFFGVNKEDENRFGVNKEDENRAVSSNSIILLAMLPLIGYYCIPFQLTVWTMLSIIGGFVAVTFLSSYLKESVITEQYIEREKYMPVNFQQNVVTYTLMQVILMCLATLDIDLFLSSPIKYIKQILAHFNGAVSRPCYFVYDRCLSTYRYASSIWIADGFFSGLLSSGGEFKGEKEEKSDSLMQYSKPDDELSVTEYAVKYRGLHI